MDDWEEVWVCEAVRVCDTVNDWDGDAVEDVVCVCDALSVCVADCDSDGVSVDDCDEVCDCEGVCEIEKVEVCDADIVCDRVVVSLLLCVCVGERESVRDWVPLWV